MSNEHYCLRWNNHQPNFISAFSNLLCNESLVDITLAAEGKYIQAHKVVLSACSSYFQLLFTTHPGQHPIVILKDVKYSDLKIVVEFMYLGEVNVSQDQLPGVLKTAETLQVKGLADMPDYMIYDKPKSVTDAPGSVKRKKFRKSCNESGSEVLGGSSSVEEVEVLGPAHLNMLRHGDMMDSKKNSQMSEYLSRNDASKEIINSRMLSQQQKSDGWTLLEQLSARPGSMLGPHNNTTPCPSDQLFPLTSSTFLDQQRKRKRNTCRGDENFERALEDVREGRVGFCKAARTYGINNRTLWLEFKKRGYQSKSDTPDKSKQQQTPSSSTVDIYNPPDVALPPPPPPPSATEPTLVEPSAADQFNQYSPPAAAGQPTPPPSTTHYSSPYAANYFAPVSSIHSLQPIQPNT